MAEQIYYVQKRTQMNIKTLHQRRYEELHKIKKFMLKNMFV